MTKELKQMWIGWDLAVIGVALGLVACDRLMAKDALQALQIQQAQVLTPGDCSVPGTPTAYHKVGGTLDLALPDGSLPPYLLALAVVNNLEAVGGSAADELNNMTLTHFTVELSAPGVTWDASCPATFDTPRFTFKLAPGASTGASLYAITPAHSRCLRGQVPAEHLIVTARVWAKGRHGGTSIESAPFVFPIEVCLGCLQTGYTEPDLIPYRYPADYPMCDSLRGSNPYLGSSCLAPGQDETILCCGVASTVGGVSVPGAICPGVFTGDPTPTGTAPPF
jgi:hypothetical protein